MVNAKMRNESQINGEKGVAILKALLPSEWVCRELSPDYGIDMEVEIFEKYSSSYITTGEHIYFQVKGTEHLDIGKYKIYERKNVEHSYEQGELYKEIDVVNFDIDTSLLATVEKMGSAVPVLLVVVDIVNICAYNVCLNDYVEKVVIPQKEDYIIQKTLRIHIPMDNIIEKKDDIIPIKWYAKRAKLFSLFSKINYQNNELGYCSDEHLYEVIYHYSKIIRRLDAWSAAELFYPLKIVRDELDYFLENGLTASAEKVIRSFEESGKDVDEECWETGYSGVETSLRNSIKISELRCLWNKICNCGFILEDLSKEWFLPTFAGCITRE